jgi:hypothetical protein
MQPGHVKKRGIRNAEVKTLLLTMAFLAVGTCTLFANGGASQIGVPGTGSASASDKGRQTDVTIENETLKIDLHTGYAAVDVRYRMHNTGSKVQQDFFFPVEQWGKNPDADTDTKSADIGDYQITVDGRKLPWTNVLGPKEESSETTSLIPLILEAALPRIDGAADEAELISAENFPSSAAAAP